MAQRKPGPAGLDQAASLHQNGRIAEAAALYRELLAELPDNPDLHHLLGVAAGQLGNHDEAVARIGQAVALAPERAEYRSNWSVALEKQGRRDRAADEANEAGRLALARRDPAAAFAPLERALALVPGHRGAALNRATALCDSGRIAEAVAALERILAIAPKDAVAWSNLGNALLAQGDTPAAIGRYRQAIQCDPGYADAYSNLGLALSRTGLESEAEMAVRHAVRLRERFPEAHVNLATALVGLGRFGEAVAGYRRAIELQPDLAIAHWNLALALLLAGSYAEGWSEYEWRWRWPDFGEPLRRFAAAPPWRGESPQALAGPLLLTAEQGFGDTIQFCRFAKVLAARGYRVILEVQRPLVTLLWSSLAADGVAVIGRGDTPAELEGNPRFAAHAPLMSLPYHLGTTLATIPAEIPYLAADPVRVARWRERLGPGVAIGVVWAGRPIHRRDRERSIAADALAPLARLPGVRLVSLQRGAEEARANLDGCPLLPLGSELFDFAETAALITALDRIVSVDTAVAHLAGALGRPASVLLPATPDWRWLLGRDDSPWYPSLRLYRQESPGAWAPAITRLAGDIAGELATRQ